jgi:Arc/MetJ-type ribon-helix-helix transcriptional regulator
MTDKLKNATFSLPEKSIKDLKRAVKDGYARSVNFAVREAVASYISKIEKEKLRKEMESASKDPLFLKDTKRSMEDFKTSDRETAESITEW